MIGNGMEAAGFGNASVAVVGELVDNVRLAPRMLKAQEEEESIDVEVSESGYWVVGTGTVHSENEGLRFVPALADKVLYMTHQAL